MSMVARVSRFEKKQKSFIQNFNYNNIENKIDLSSYQDDVEDNLVNKIVEDLILFINL